MLLRIAKKITDWQHWPFYVFYSPLCLAWVSYYIKSRSLWYYTASNPTLSFGGFEGEGKTEMYRQLPQHLCPRTVEVEPFSSFAEVVRKVQEKGLAYPFIVKPDVGMKGILFRKIEREDQLRQYHERMPAAYLVQEFLDTPYEVSVFYCRLPGNERGEITAMIQKNLLEVIGDGHSTLEELIRRSPSAAPWLEKMRRERGQQLPRILAAGERYCLSHVANLMNGAHFINLTKKVSEPLVRVFDEISHSNQFNYGRYDIKCHSIEDILEGRNFYILEFNGAGSVPNHIFTGDFTLLGAYKEILKHWKTLYTISKINKEKGIDYWGLKKGYTFLQNSKQHFKVLKKLDKELILI
jgi:D-alanine-D-alanine ligase-like ATP-grasp enzyme